MPSVESLRWFLLEAIVPVFGPGILFWLAGAMYWIVAEKRHFTFNWTQAFDPFGWLYGSSVVAVQSGMKGISLGTTSWIGWALFAGAVISGILLMFAMLERGRVQDKLWVAPVSMNVVVVGLTAGIMGLGFVVHSH